MRLWQKLSDALGRNKTTVAAQELSGQMFLSPLCSAYENIFPQVRPLIDALKEVQPYGVGRNGAQLPLVRTPELALLQNPNTNMGWSEFMDLAFAMWLTESELYIHVWKNGRGKAFGYTILPPTAKVDLGNGDYYFQVLSSDGGTEQLSKDEVMTLCYSRNPRGFKGVSPAQTVVVQTQIADLLYQYERAFIENGAVPAYITIIRASTKEKFEETKKDLERGFKGAGNKGKTLYLWRQYLPDGTEADQVEVKTIQPNNSTLAIKEIISIVKDDFNKAFGVSEFILGNDSSAKYDNAELSQQQFMLHRVKPALSAFWSQFQHELERICGITYGIGWDLEIPELTDRIKVKAEISEKNVDNLTKLIDAGSTAGAAVAALNLTEEWLDVAYGIYDEKQRRQNAETLSTVLSNAASTTTAAAQNADKLQKTDQKAGVCAKSSHECTHCHHTHDNKTDEDITFGKGEEKEQAIYDELTKILDNAIREALGEGVQLSEDDLTKIKIAILDQLIAEAEKGENDAAVEIKGYALGATAAAIADVLDNGGYHVTPEFEQHMKDRVELVVSKLDETARDTARKILSSEEGLSASELKKKLSEVMPAARAETIARNETVYAYRAGSLENAKNLAKEYDLKIKKTWHAQPDACDICKAMDGKTVELLDAFPEDAVTKDGEQVSWKHTAYNDDGEVTQAHVNCRCVPEYEVVYD